MTKPTKLNVFTKTDPKPETPMEKTTRAVTQMVDGETEQREIKTARLRKARLEKEADETDKVVPPKTKEARKKPLLKTTK